MLIDFEALTQQHVLVVLRNYWFGIFRRDGQWFVYNCHASPECPGCQITGEEPASIVRAESAAEVTELLVHFIAADENYKGWYDMYEIKMSPK